MGDQSSKFSYSDNGYSRNGLKLGRRSAYSPELVALICERLADGTTLAQICRMPDIPIRPRTYQDWINRYPEVAEATAKARILGFDAIAEEALDIADGRIPDGEGNVDPSRDKLRVETRLKLLAKWDPKRWGDKVQHADANGDKLPDMSPVITDIMVLLRPNAALEPPMQKLTVIDAADQEAD